MKQTIRLAESKLRRMIKESVRAVINEGWSDEDEEEWDEDELEQEEERLTQEAEELFYEHLKEIEPETIDITDDYEYIEAGVTGYYGVDVNFNDGSYMEYTYNVETGELEETSDFCYAIAYAERSKRITLPNGHWWEPTIMNIDSDEEHDFYDNLARQTINKYINEFKQPDGTLRLGRFRV